jgi:hypothetical protein
VNGLLLDDAEPDLDPVSGDSGLGDWNLARVPIPLGGVSISQIARVLGVSRNTVRSALTSTSPPKYQREPAGSAVDAVEAQIRELLRAFPTMPATVIAERIGWTRSIRTLSGRGRGAAAGVSAARSCVADQLCRWGDRAVRSVVPTDPAADRVRSVPSPARRSASTSTRHRK